MPVKKISSRFSQVKFCPISWPVQLPTALLLLRILSACASCSPLLLRPQCHRNQRGSCGNVSSDSARSSSLTMRMPLHSLFKNTNPDPWQDSLSQASLCTVHRHTWLLLVWVIPLGNIVLLCNLFSLFRYLFPWSIQIFAYRTELLIRYKIYVLFSRK